MSFELSNSAELALQLCGLDKNEEQIVRNCIQRYSRSEGFGDKVGLGDKVSQLVYMVLEELKSKWNGGDWQQSEKILKEKFFKVIPKLLQNDLTYAGAGKAGQLGMSTLLKLNACELKIPRPVHSIAVYYGNLNMLSGLLNRFLEKKAPLLLLDQNGFQEKLQGMARQKAGELAGEILSTGLNYLKERFSFQPDVHSSVTKKFIDVTAEEQQQRLSKAMVGVALAESNTSAA